MPELMQSLFLAGSAMILLAAAVATLRVTPWPMLGVLAALSWTASVIPPPPLLSAGGTSVYVGDIVAVVAATAAAVGLGGIRRSLGGRAIPALILVLLLVFNLARGWSIYAQSAVNEARSIVYLVAVVAYFLSLDLQRWRGSILRFFVWLSVALSVLALLRWRTSGFGSATRPVYLGDNVYGTSRALLASQAIIIAIGAIIVLYRWAEKRRPRDILLAGWLLAVVALLQHRSVWVATAASIVGFVNVRPDLRRRVFATIFAGVVLAAPLLVSRVGGTAAESLAESASTASVSGDTFKFRTEGWAQLIGDSRAEGPVAVAVGQPFGSSLERVVLGRSVSVSAHNFYVSLYLRAGVIGVGLLLALGVVVSRGEPSLRLAMTMAIATYGLAYSVDYLVAPIVALVLLSATPGRQQTGRASDLTSHPRSTPRERQPVPT